MLAALDAVETVDVVVMAKEVASGASVTVPRKASEVGACKDLEGHVFTIGSGNKIKSWGYAQNLNGKDGYLHWYQVWQ
jgi:hypothetical protein